MERLVNVLVVAAGSALGGSLRYLVSLWAQARGWTSFPWATWIVNVVGCFTIAFILTLGATVTMSTNTRLFLTTGIMGGLTTYSTFNYETTALFQGSATVTALANLGGTLVACFVAGLLGIAFARFLVAD
jgi:CrcB protein